MKKQLQKIAILLIILLTGDAFASSKKDQKIILANLSKLEKGADNASLTKVKESFASLANNSESDWVLTYYAAYSTLLAGIGKTEPKEKDLCFDEAIQFIEKAEKMSPSNAEILVLKSWALGMKISIDPNSRGRTLGPESASTIAEAMVLDPSNPRVYYLMGMVTMYTPEEYGGGKDIALSFFETALEKYKTFKLPSKEMPNWGKKQTIEAIAECKK